MPPPRFVYLNPFIVKIQIFLALMTFVLMCLSSVTGILFYFIRILLKDNLLCAITCVLCKAMRLALFSYSIYGLSKENHNYQTAGHYWTAILLEYLLKLDKKSIFRVRSCTDVRSCDSIRVSIESFESSIILRTYSEMVIGVTDNCEAVVLNYYYITGNAVRIC
ncbi:hypothetical protein GQX74_008081 [Glossina fuscipes]|nr:hypothetical protein GQX74_008081 [Glossina fuscipes]